MPKCSKSKQFSYANADKKNICIFNLANFIRDSHNASEQNFKTSNYERTEITIKLNL